MRKVKAVVTIILAVAAFLFILYTFMNIVIIQSVYGDDFHPCERDPDMELVDPAIMPDFRYVGVCTVTHYTVCVEECGKADGITASGRLAIPEYSVAVDPAVIPLGATVLIEWSDGRQQLCRADDTGGFSGKHIDLCVEDRQDAIQRGKKLAHVYYLKEKR